MFYTPAELSSLGLATFGNGVLIDRTVQLIHPAGIHIGSHVRIDAFALISAGPEGVHLGDHVHLAMGAALFGGSARILVEDFAGLSARTIVYTGNDDYTGGALTGPTVPDRYRNVKTGDVTLRRHVIVGAGSIILPGLEIGVGAAVGAMSLVTRPVSEFAIVAGVPARKIGTRDARLLEREERLREDERGASGNARS